MTDLNHLLEFYYVLHKHQELKPHIILLNIYLLYYFTSTYCRPENSFRNVLFSVAFACCFFVPNTTLVYKKCLRYLNQTFRHNL